MRKLVIFVGLGEVPAIDQRGYQITLPGTVAETQYHWVVQLPLQYAIRSHRQLIRDPEDLT